MDAHPPLPRRLRSADDPSPRMNKHKVGLAALAKGQPMAKKLAALRKREHERQLRITAEIDSWFERFDTNHDGKLQRDELRELLTWLHPSRPPTDENLDTIIKKASAIETFSMHIKGDANADLAWRDVRPAVLQYNDYVKDQNYIDTVFARFDVDSSGELDRAELLLLLKSIAPDQVEVDETDVEYILSCFDLNSDGLIDRQELLPLLAKWSHIAFEKVEKMREERQRTIAKQWNLVKAEAAEVAHAVQGGGARVVNLVQAARQAREKQKVVQSKWQRAANSATDPAGGKSGGLIRIVEAAKRQQEAERRASVEGAASVVTPVVPSLPVAEALAAGEMPAGLQHSRSESMLEDSQAARDRDASWRPTDEVNARRLEAIVRRNTQKLELQHSKSSMCTIS